MYTNIIFIELNFTYGCIFPTYTSIHLSTTGAVHFSEVSTSKANKFWTLHPPPISLARSSTSSASRFRRDSHTKPTSFTGFAFEAEQITNLYYILGWYSTFSTTFQL